ncbi:hypothetical protein T12_3690 [Trichinella patagoniensis]|uniref:Uncharacterized protein n=1 Tax=Trichinella patagoniensis TaxID=990121 RepID=A0A0V0Z6B2_9BILA|nr:hypothetical protein T12_3690 [Trichinella patagoniensis]
MYCSVHWGCVGSTHIVKRIRLLRAMPTPHHASDPLFCTRPYSSHNFFLQKSPFDTQFAPNFSLEGVIPKVCRGRHARDDLLTSVLYVLKAPPFDNCGKC